MRPGERTAVRPLSRLICFIPFVPFFIYRILTIHVGLYRLYGLSFLLLYAYCACSFVFLAHFQHILSLCMRALTAFTTLCAPLVYQCLCFQLRPKLARMTKILPKKKKHFANWVVIGLVDRAATSQWQIWRRQLYFACYVEVE